MMATLTLAPAVAVALALLRLQPRADNCRGERARHD